MPIGPENWCSALRPTSRINELSIPGTHDAAAWTHHENLPSSTPATWAHRKSITEQLNLGVRVLDLRVGYRLGWLGEKTAGMYHGPVDLSISMDEVLAEIGVWIGNHTTEFVILIFQQQGKFKGYAGDIAQDVQRKVHEHIGDHLFPFRGIDAWPKVEDLAGKVLVMGRLESDVDCFCDVREWQTLGEPEEAHFRTGEGLNILLQDRYKNLSSSVTPEVLAVANDYPKKLKLVERTARLGIEEPDTLTINHLSHSSLLCQPWQIGKVMNELLRASRFPLRGLLMIDDADKDTVNHIFAHNF